MLTQRGQLLRVALSIAGPPCPADRSLRVLRIWREWWATVAIRISCLAMFVFAMSFLAGCVSFVRFPSVAANSPLLTAELYRPDISTRRPAVVLLHPCGGLEPFMRDWGQWLQSKGYVALVVDSFTARGVTNVCESRYPSWGEAARDALGALRYLRTLPFVDAERVAVMGWSYGGAAALLLSREMFLDWADQQGKWSDQQGNHPGFRAAIALYPPCEMAGPDIRVPLLMLLAGRDDWTPARFCIEVTEQFKGGTLPVRSVVYATAVHGFDQPRQPTTYLGHSLAYDEAATRDAREQVRLFLEETFR